MRQPARRPYLPANPGEEEAHGAESGSFALPPEPDKPPVPNCSTHEWLALYRMRLTPET